MFLQTNRKMKRSNLRIIGTLWVKSTGDQWIPLTTARNTDMSPFDKIIMWNLPRYLKPNLGSTSIKPQCCDLIDTKFVATRQQHIDEWIMVFEYLSLIDCNVGIRSDNFSLIPLLFPAPNFHKWDICEMDDHFSEFCFANYIHWFPTIPL